MMKQKNSLLAVLLVPLLATSYSPLAEGIAWEPLDEQQQQVLSLLKDSRDQLSPERWHSISPEHRDQLRERRRRFQSLSPEQQERLRKRHEWFQQLPEEKRRALREEWQNMSPEERKAFREKRRQKWESMTPQQREKMKQRWQERRRQVE